jgi:hypothetical protein
MRKIWVWMSIVVAALTASAFIRAAEEQSAKKPPSGEDMMAMMAKVAAIGPEHDRLKTMAGTFNAEVTAQMMPGMPPQVSKGTVKNEMALGGKFLRSDYDGTFMGKPFKGMGLLGFDNVKKKYVSFWVDDMSTGMMMSEGTADESAKTITTSGQFDCPMDNTKHSMRQVITLTDDDHHTYEMYDTGPDGKENKMMTIKYTRAR